MNAHSPQRGGAPVGMITDLGPVEAGAVLYFRLWFDGPESQAQVWNDLAAGLGTSTGRAVLRSFEQLCDLCVRHGRRPLMRHDVTCRCLGSDESCFANFVASAADGEREDAMLIATLLVKPDLAPCLVAVAEDFGLALKRMALRAEVPHAYNNKQKTLH